MSSNEILFISVSPVLSMVPEESRTSKNVCWKDEWMNEWVNTSKCPFSCVTGYSDWTGGDSLAKPDMGWCGGRGSFPRQMVTIVLSLPPPTLLKIHFFSKTQASVSLFIGRQSLKPLLALLPFYLCHDPLHVARQMIKVLINEVLVI